MSKESNHEIYSLIEGMTGGEKRYFKIFSSLYDGDSENKYIQLFNIIESNGIRNDEELEERCTEIKLSQIPNLKNYLTRQVLRSLRIYKSGFTDDMRLRELFDEVEILFSKKMYKSCYKRLREIKKKAYDGDKHLFFIMALRWEDTIDKYMLDVKKIEKRVNSSYEEERLAIKRQENFLEYLNLFSKVLLLEFKQGYERNRVIIKQMEELMENRLLKNEKNALTDRSKMMMYQAKCTYYYSIEDYGMTKSYLEKIVGLMGRNSYSGADQMTGYFTQMKNLLIVNTQLRKAEEFYSVLHTIRTLPERYPRIKGAELEKMIFEASCSEELNHYMVMGQLTRALEKTSYGEAGLKKYKGQLVVINELNICYNLGSIYYYMNMYDEALEKINVILNYPDTSIAENLYCFSRILFLMINYDLGNYDLVESRIKSTARFLNKRERLYKFESLILDSVRKLLNAAGKEEEEERFEEMKSDIILLSREPFEKHAADDLEILSWLNSKLSGRSFAEEIEASRKGV